MKWKALALVAGVGSFVAASVAYACDSAVNKSMIATGRGLSLNLGVNIDPSSPLSWVGSGGLGIGLGDRIAVMPFVGLCHLGAEDGEEAINEVMFGGAVAVRLIGDASSKFTLNGQAGVSMVSYSDFDEDETDIPIVAAGNYQASEKAGIYFGGGIQIGKFKGPGFDESDSDPIFFGGVNLMMGKCTLNGGLNFKVGDVDTDTAINVGLRFPIGG